jgi:hypothetical protein
MVGAAKNCEELLVFVSIKLLARSMTPCPGLLRLSDAGGL